MKHNRTLIRFLLLALVVVWGAVGARLLNLLGSVGAGETSKSESGPRAPRSQAHYQYTPDFHDPFQIQGNQDSSKAAKKPKMADLWKPPELKLTGILLGRRGRSAAVQTPDGNLYFLFEGDTLSGTRLLKIGPEKVTYVFAKKKSEWLLEAP